MAAMERSSFSGCTAVVRFCLGILFSSTSVDAQDTTGVLTSSANFLDSGLATIGSIAAWGNTLARGRLDFEMGLRDLVHGEVAMTIVDKWSEARHSCIRENLIDWQFNVIHVGEAGYAASNVLVEWLVRSNGSRVLQIAGKWLRDELSPLDCNASHLCHCLCLPKETYQLMGILHQDNSTLELCRDLSDIHFVLLCSDCTADACHTSLGETIHLFQGTSTCALEDEVLNKVCKTAEQFRLRRWLYWSSLSDVLPHKFDGQVRDSKPIEDFVVLSDGLSDGAVRDLGLTSIPTADESSRQALPKVCATLRDDNRSSMGLQVLEWQRHPLRYPVLLMVETVVQWMLVLFLHLDGFSSALASRRLLGSLISDGTSTRSPIEATIPEARLGWNGGSGYSFGYAIRWWYPWRARAIAYIPSCANVIGMAGWCILVVWQVDFAFYSNAYTGAIPTWAVIYAMFTTLLSLLVTVFGTTREDPQWNTELRRLRTVGACVQVLVILFLILHVTTHWRLSNRRALYPILLIGALCQWVVGAAHIGSHAASIYGYSWRHSVLYSCAFLQLSSLTSIGGRWK